MESTKKGSKLYRQDYYILAQYNFYLYDIYHYFQDYQGLYRLSFIPQNRQQQDGINPRGYIHQQMGDIVATVKPPNPSSGWTPLASSGGRNIPSMPYKWPRGEK